MSVGDKQQSEESRNNRLIWIDLEMTGLVVEKEVIIEIATIVTDSDLNILAQGPSLAIKQPESYLQNMDQWNQTHHTRSGLVDRVRQSQITNDQAQEQTLTFLKQFVNEGTSPMCGNSICQDRRFLARYMPRLEAFFHYRNIDVSTIKELAKFWRPEVARQVVKKGAHLALEDILESIEELRVYKNKLFTPETGG